MSLQIWLPLNGDLENNGLADITVTNSGATVNDSGKIGKCYSFNGSNNYLRVDPVLTNDQTFSFACWMKLNSIPSSYYCLLCSRTNTASTGIGIWLKSDKTFYVDVGSRWATSSQEIDAGQWYHIAVTSSTQGRKLYINGVQVANSGITTNPTTVNTSCVLIGAQHSSAAGTADGTYFNGFLNDVRIYDHCLTQKEVKELSKGLAIHYKLDDRWAETTTNLFTALSNTCYNGATSKYGYGTTTDMYKTTGEFEGKYCTKVYMGTSGNPARPYTYFGNLFVSNGGTDPEYKTLSFYYFTNVTDYVCFYKLGTGTATVNWTVLNSSGKTIGTNAGESSAAGFIPIAKDEWNYLELVLHGTSTDNAQFGYCINGAAHTSDISYYWLFANVQIESKDHSTGYAGDGGSRSGIQAICDSSGYSNNGIAYNIIVDNESPRYSASSVFNSSSSSYIKVTETAWMAQYAEEMTINLWAYSADWTTVTNGRMFSCTETGGWNVEGGASGYWRFSRYVATNAAHSSHTYQYNNSGIKLSDLTPGWHMFTFVYTTTAEYLYVDGLPHSHYALTSYGIKYNTSARLFLGCEAATANPYSPYFTGKESDFRLYYTALSSDDVLELYNTVASVDRNGSIYVYEFNEVAS